MSLARIFTGVLGVAVAAWVAGAPLASAAGATVTRTMVANGYRVVLIIGPAEMMNASGGEKMTGGKMAVCKEPGATSSGMSMTEKTCNHHVEVHVYRASASTVITNAKVSISLNNTATKTAIMLPIATMHGSAGMNDVHYGNNVHAGAGTYRVVVYVNGKKFVFSNVHLM